MTRPMARARAAVEQALRAGELGGIGREHVRMLAARELWTRPLTVCP
jgi:hypothetical protein